MSDEEIKAFREEAAEAEALIPAGNEPGGHACLHTHMAAAVRVNNRCRQQGGDFAV